MPSSLISSEHTVLNKINIPDLTMLSLDLPFIHHSNFFLKCFGTLYSLPTISTAIILAQDHYHFIPELLYFSLCSQPYSINLILLKVSFKTPFSSHCSLIQKILPLCHLQCHMHTLSYFPQSICQLADRCPCTFQHTHTSFPFQ